MHTVDKSETDVRCRKVQLIAAFLLSSLWLCVPVLRASGSGPTLSTTTDFTTVSELQVAHLTAAFSDSSCGTAVTWASSDGDPVPSRDGIYATYTAPASIDSSRSIIVSATSVLCTGLHGETVISLVHKYQWQGLVQLHNGMARAGTKPPALQMQGNWVVFTDAVTGSEIWQLDGDESPGTVQIPGILNRTPWNKNGQHFILSSDRCVPNQFCGDVHQFLYNADGSFARPIIPRDPTRTPTWARNVGLYGYAPWDNVNPNVLYWATGNDNNHGFFNSPQSSVYAINIAEGDLATKIVDLPNPTRRKTIQSYLTSDNILMVQDANPDLTSGITPTFIVNLYMINVSKKKLLYSYPINFGLRAPNHSSSEEYHLHDIYFRRSVADTYIFNYGPKTMVGESVFFEMPLKGDATEGKLAYSDAAAATPYYSHPAWNRDGTLVTYSGESVLGSNKWGVWIRNHDERKTLAQVGTSANHIGWDGYDPNFVVYDGWTGPTSYDLTSATTDGKMTRTLVRLPPRDANNPGPNMLIGPAQSPDATKVMFAAPLEFVTGAKLKTYIAVDHRPIAPTVAVTSTSPMVLRWTPYLASHEVKGYRVYRSSRLNAEFDEISKGLVTGTAFEDPSAIAQSTYFYAVTAEENSGLESDQPSVVKATIGGESSAATWLSGQRVYTTPPAAPTELIAVPTKQGVWSLSWTPSRSMNVRYYNIYYATSGAPSATQTYQVASVPAGRRTFTYWLADATAPAHFAITAVDRQGNTSPAINSK